MFAITAFFFGVRIPAEDGWAVAVEMVGTYERKLYCTAGKRMMRTERVINRRLRLMKRIGHRDYYDELASERYRLAKQHPLDCGQPKCVICHADKVLGVPKAKYELTASAKRRFRAAERTASLVERISVGGESC